MNAQGLMMVEAFNVHGGLHIYPHMQSIYAGFAEFMNRVLCVHVFGTLFYASSYVRERKRKNVHIRH